MYPHCCCWGRYGATPVGPKSQSGWSQEVSWWIQAAGFFLRVWPEVSCMSLARKRLKMDWGISSPAHRFPWGNAGHTLLPLIFLDVLLLSLTSLAWYHGLLWSSHIQCCWVLLYSPLPMTTELKLRKMPILSPSHVFGDLVHMSRLCSPPETLSQKYHLKDLFWRLFELTYRKCLCTVLYKCSYI